MGAAFNGSGHLIITLSDETAIDAGGAVVSAGGYKGIATPNCTGLYCYLGITDIMLRWADPDDVVYGGAKLTEWQHTKLVRKIGSYPIDENDGVLIKTNTVRNQHATSGLYDYDVELDTPYYYKLFPIAKSGAVNTAANNNYPAPQVLEDFPD
ncbi:MAG: hypothetical protein LBN40_04750 [Oscillospiraceae bacterium]|nr:hypothetical protein [Oscillospiraceae bacterium]